jgi:hypothetical protein
VEAVVGERGRVGVRAQQEVGGLDVAVREAGRGVQVHGAGGGWGFGGRRRTSAADAASLCLEAGG